MSDDALVDWVCPHCLGRTDRTCCVCHGKRTVLPSWEASRWIWERSGCACDTCRALAAQRSRHDARPARHRTDPSADDSVVAAPAPPPSQWLRVRPVEIICADCRQIFYAAPGSKRCGSCDVEHRRAYQRQYYYRHRHLKECPA